MEQMKQAEWRPSEVCGVMGAGNVLRGIAASAGVARGFAHICRSPSDINDTQTGGILVIVNAEACWTSVFPCVQGIVAEVGGVLGNSLTVAREYRLPAVIGVHAATHLIREGEVLEVDGDQGLVRRILSGQSPPSAPSPAIEFGRAGTLDSSCTSSCTAAQATASDVCARCESTTSSSRDWP